MWFSRCKYCWCCCMWSGQCQSCRLSRNNLEWCKECGPVEITVGEDVRKKPLPKTVQINWPCSSAAPPKCSTNGTPWRVEGNSRLTAILLLICSPCTKDRLSFLMLVLATWKGERSWTEAVFSGLYGLWIRPAFQYCHFILFSVP